jgi:DNA-binding Lrp family transcriptional regulator
MPQSLDAIDRKILAVLQGEGRIQNIELAGKVGLSPSPCLRRVKNLEADGAIRGYVALLDGPEVGLPLTIFCRVTLDRQDKVGVESFAKAMAQVPEVLECFLMAGTYDYLLKVAAKDLNDYQRFQMEHLTPLPGVRNVVTEIPLKAVKATTALPV